MPSRIPGWLDTQLMTHDTIYNTITLTQTIEKLHSTPVPLPLPYQIPAFTEIPGTGSIVLVHHRTALASDHRLKEQKILINTP
jgi:hypothetical protein